MSHLKAIYILGTIFTFSLISCKTKAPSTGLGGNFSACPFRSVDWLEVVDSSATTSEKSASLDLGNIISGLTGIVASSDTGSLPKLRGQVKSLETKYSTRKARVSQQFYEYYLGRTIRLCGIWEYIQTNNFQDTSLRKQYEQLLLDTQKELQEKQANSVSQQININQVNSGSGTQNNYNNVFLHPEDTINQKTNVVFELDRVKKVGYVYPRAGEWKLPMLLVNSKDALAISKFTNEKGVLYNSKAGIRWNEMPDIVGFSYDTEINSFSKGIVEFSYFPDAIVVVDRSDTLKKYVITLPL